MPVVSTKATTEVACQPDAPVEISEVRTLRGVAAANKDLFYEQSTRVPPQMQFHTDDSLLLKEVTATNVYGFPSYVRDLAPLVQHLARRVIWDTDRGTIVADEVIHDQSMTMCLRDSLPVDVYNIRIQYYRGSTNQVNITPAEVDEIDSAASSAESDSSIPERRSVREQKKRASKSRAQRKVNPKEERRKRWLSASTAGGEFSLAASGESMKCTPCLAPRKKQSDEDGTVTRGWLTIESELVASNI